LTALLLFPVVLSLLVMGAHFLRAGQVLPLVAVPVMLVLLAVRKPWAARVVQAGLLLGAVEWIRTLVQLANARAAAGEPATRMVVILGVVVAVTALSALLFQTKTLRRMYGLS